MDYLISDFLANQTSEVSYFLFFTSILGRFCSSLCDVLRKPGDKTDPLVEPLTNHELDVLELLAQRFQNKEIAEKLFISDGTIKAHLKNIYQKLKVSKRREAVEKAEEIGIL